MKKLKINKNKAEDWPKFPVGYGKGVVIMVPYPMNPREGRCDACGRSVQRGDIKTTHLHHWIYAYKHNTVKKDPFKVLENLSEVCYTCHKVADALRNLLFLKKEKLWMVVKAALLMPDELKRKLDWLTRAWLNARKTDKKRTKLNHYL